MFYTLSVIDEKSGEDTKQRSIEPEGREKFPLLPITAMKSMQDRKRCRAIIASSGGYDARQQIGIATLNLETGRLKHVRVLDADPKNDYACRVVDHIASIGLRVFQAETGLEEPPLAGLDDERNCGRIDLSLDGRLIALARRPRTSDGVSVEPFVGDVVIYERATGRKIVDLPRGRLGQFVFSPNGRLLATAQPEGLGLWDLAGNKNVWFRKGHENFDWQIPNSFASAIAFSPDSRRIATSHPDATILIWDATPPAKARPTSFSKTELDALWNDLADPDAKKGWTAVWHMQDRPEQAITLLADRVKPVCAIATAEMKKSIDTLDAGVFRDRETAMKKLAELGDAARPGLQKALTGKLTAEQEKRVRELLGELDSRKPPRGDDLRGIRALAILEFIKTEESRKLIASLATGLESARLTREAKETLERLPRSDR